MYQNGYCYRFNACKYIEKPHIVHNDDYAEKIYPIYKTLVLPLEISEPTNFVTFDQAYLDGPVKLFRGYDPVPESYYNKSLTDYSNIINYTDKPFDEEIHQKYLSYYLNPQCMKGHHHYHDHSLLIEIM